MTSRQQQQTKIPTDWDVDVIDYWNASLSSYKKHHEDPEKQVTLEKVTTEFLDSLPVKKTKIDIETKPVEEINKPLVKRKATAVETTVTQESQIGEWSFVTKEEEEEEEQEEEEQVINEVEEEEEEGYHQEEYIGEPMPKKVRYQHQHPQQSLPQQAPMPTLPMMPQDNEGLSNLIMAWYYAGYYTGLYQANQRQ